jgi:hypothetical protein
LRFSARKKELGMSSRRRFGSVAATAAVIVVAGAASSAWAEQPGVGEFPTEQAGENCGATIDRQTEMDVSAGGGPKEGVPAPTNCDHFFGAPGQP